MLDRDLEHPDITYIRANGEPPYVSYKENDTLIEVVEVSEDEENNSCQ